MSLGVLFLFFVVFFLFAFPKIYAQNTVSALNFEDQNADLGRFPYNHQPIVHSFPFVVGSDSALHIEEVLADCACIAVEYPKKALKPGRKDSLKVAYFPYKAGGFEKKFTLKLRGIPKKYTLSIAGYIAPFAADPELAFPHAFGNLRFKSKHIALGNITNQGVLRKSVPFYNASQKIVTFSDSVISPPHIEVVFNKTAKLIGGKRKATFDLYYHPEIKNDFGYLVDNLVLFTEEPTKKQLNFTVTAVISQYFSSDESATAEKPQLVVNNSTQNLGQITLSPYRVETASFILRNVGKKMLKIHRANAQEGCTLVSENYQRIAPGDTAVLKVQIKDIGKSGTQERKILLYTNDAHTPVKLLKVRMKVKRK